jgi:glycine cleavage system H protein
MTALRFTKDHEWVRLDGHIATVGITNHAQHCLGDVVFVGLPEKGEEISEGGVVAVVESVKAASDVYAPLSGVVLETNAAIVVDPSLVNSAPEAEGWFFTMRVVDPSQFDGLMDASAYAGLVGEAG